VVRRQDTDTKVQFFLADGDFDPPVLRAAAFGDIHPRKDFDAGGDGR